MKKKRMKLLWKFMVSYIVVLLLPLTVILFYYYPYSTSIVKQKEMDWNEHVTEQVANSMDIFMKSVYTLPASIVDNREIKFSLIGADDYQRLVVTNEMKKYNSLDALFYNTFLYVKKNGYLFSRTGFSYELKEFMNPKSGFVYADWSPEQFARDLDRLDSIQVRPTEDVTIVGEGRVKMITILLPLPLGNSREGSVLFMIKHDTLARLMKSVSNAYTGDFIILDQNDNPIFTLSERDDLRSAGFKQFMSRLQSGKSGVYSYDGTSYIASQTVSQQNGWKYVSINPLKQALQQTKETQRNTFVLVGIILLIEIMVISVSIRKNYNPIKALVHLSKSVFGGVEEKRGNELDIIHSALRNLSDENYKLDESVKRSVPKVRDTLLSELLSGQYASLEQFAQEANAYGLRFGYPKCSVAVLASEGDAEAILSELKRREPSIASGIDGYFIKGIHHEDIVFVSTHRPDVSLECALRELKEEIASRVGTKLCIGIGNEADGPEGFHVSYMNALRAVEHLRIKNDTSIVSFDSLTERRNESVPYPSEAIHSLELFILTNDVPEVRRTVAHLIEFLRQDRTPPFMIRAVYWNLSHILAGSLHRLKHQEGIERLSATTFQDRFSVGEMTALLKESTELLCGLMTNATASAKAATLDDVLHYIEENEYAPTFSLQTVAERYGMSVSNFSHYFKKTAGQNFKEYVDGRRIQKSKQLLIQTRLPLEQVAGQTGYANTSSFIRAFKKSVGVTPGQFREINR
ncbi:helix-turn-helix domain-containing protein [Cohnella thailandensis]|uniref:AraC family transcriptional regulator n=1 Tax=Cohnella thailandensis TaxID=557557 RepID=A0A841STL0_9BACL|nr:helix-turn-helix domain-containing protein [Cohnella thailandensis]MBB6634562.1 AraC family transcriptional regulator [Cohnella thailandensis]MBP1972883.1 AraC-like DNA-binding protein/flagellar basal body-associated protein FliL [Cohnella thailandensis]